MGIGFEWMFTPNWTFWVEWDHIFLDNTPIAIIDSRDTIHRDFDKVLFGISVLGALPRQSISTTCLPQLKHNLIRYV